MKDGEGRARKNVYEGVVDMGGEEGKGDGIRNPGENMRENSGILSLLFVHSLIPRLHSRLGTRLTGPYRL